MPALRKLRLAGGIGALVASVNCSSSSDVPVAAVDAGKSDAVRWVATGQRSELPAELVVENATAITIDATHLYWITTDAFLYRAPRAGGEVGRVPLPAPGALLGAHNDVFVGWTEADGNSAIAEIAPATGAVKTVSHHPGRLRGLVAGQRGHSFATATNAGTVVQTCHDGSCTQPHEIASDFASLALDLPTKTFYVLTADGLRTCTIAGGCPAQATTTPPGTQLIASLPGTYFSLDSKGQAWGAGGAAKLGSAAVPGATKLVVVDGNGKTASPVGTWSSGARLAQGLLAAGTTTTELPTACTDFDVDATGRPIYCLVGNKSITLVP